MSRAVNPIGTTAGAADHLFPAREVMAVDHVIAGGATRNAGPQQGGIRRKVYGDSPVEDVERSLPQALISGVLAIANNPTVELIDLLESTSSHERRQHFTTNAPRAVGDDGHVLEVVKSSAVKLPDEVPRGSHVGNNRTPKSPNLCLESVASVKERDVGVVGDEFLELRGAEFCASPNDA